jgi:acetylornithine/succinyldiaminopimelate/putrescine aminotransferase/predicted amino acid dehydrogenase
MSAPVPATDAYAKYARPLVARYLASIGLDAVYLRAEGDYLWMRRGETDVKVLDLVGGFGANLLGHHHPEIVAEARRLLDLRAPVLAQGSIRSGAGLLAEQLCRRLGDYVVIFTNSGAETVEAAIKHLHLERRRPVLWAVKGAFHGKTSAAAQLTWMQREQYAGLGPTVRFIDPDDPEDWECARAEATTKDSISGVFIEAIQGEGGVRPLPAPFMDWLRRTCTVLGIPIVADEIQTGFGRTGTFLASEAIGLQPDYVCLSKALGAGLAKIGALLIRRQRFQEEFSVSQTSTFAEDDWSSLLALKALEIIDRDGLIERCRIQGQETLDRLSSLRAEFPDVVKDVRGRGLMLGVELADCSDSASITLSAISQQGNLGWLVSAYLLNVHDIRVAPTISQPSTLRIEPSAYIASADIGRFVNALRDVCKALANGDSAHLLGFLVGRHAGPVTETRFRRQFTVEAVRTRRRVGFIGFLNNPEQLGAVDPSLGRFSGMELNALIQRTSSFVQPAMSDRVHVRSRTGDEVHLSLIGIGRTAEEVARLKVGNDLAEVVEDIDRAVALARDEGCTAVGLGGYTSSVTSNCLRIQTKGIALTSGNSLAVGMGFRALKEATAHLEIVLSRSWLAVVGVPGNIAATFARMMANDVHGLVLVARNAGSPRVRAFVDSLQRSSPGKPIEVTDTVNSLRKCPLIFTATVGAAGLIQPQHLGPGPIVICDMSVPSDVADSVATERPDILVIPGGIVRLKGNESLSITGLGLRSGHVLACMAETLLMGLEEMTSHGSYGAISTEQVERMMALADKHDFVLADIDYTSRGKQYIG